MIAGVYLVKWDSLAIIVSSSNAYSEASTWRNAMIKEWILIALICLIVLSFSPHIGMLLSVLGVLILLSLPIAALVVLIIPSFRSRFLSA